MNKKLKITVEGKTYEVEVEEIKEVQGSTTASVSRPAAPAPAPSVPKAETKPAAQQPAKEAAKPAPGAGEVVPAPIPGKVLTIKVQPGDTVGAGQVILILEAMKMENEITAPVDGQIKEILVVEGQAVNSGDAMLVIG